MNMTSIDAAVIQMIELSQGNVHDIDHFLKVHAFAALIGRAEGLDARSLETLELAAVVHDIACPLVRQKYEHPTGRHQEIESEALLRPFFEDLSVRVPKETVERIVYLVSHHHTVYGVDGIDYQILLEADFLVNAGESGYPRKAIEKARDGWFETATGKRLIAEMFLR